MTDEQLEKATMLQEKRKFIKLALRDLEEVAVFIGSQFRLDKYEDIHERIVEKMKEELNIIHQELNDEISNI